MTIRPAALLLAIVASTSYAAPDGGGASKGRPVEVGKAASQPVAGGYPTEDFPLPVRVIESPGDATDRKHREARADQHEQADLTAQVRSADAAEAQVWLNKIALALSAIAAFGLFLSVYYARASAKGAVDAANAAVEAAKAANRSARAAIGIELPIIRALAPTLWATDSRVMDTPHTAPGSGIQDLTRYSKIGEWNFSNLGRTAAHPERLLIGWSICKTLDDKPVYTERIEARHDAVINPGEPYEFRHPVGIEATAEQCAAALRNDVWLWVYGSLQYVDFMGDQQTAKFCWRYGKDRHPRQSAFNFESDGDPPAAYKNEKTLKP
jgi:hypothetical protein